MSLSTYRSLGTGAAFYHPINKTTFQDHSVQFVDDTSQFLNPLGANLDALESRDIGADLLPFAPRNSQIWAELLCISGGV